MNQHKPIKRNRRESNSNWCTVLPQPKLWKKCTVRIFAKIIYCQIASQRRVMDFCREEKGEGRGFSGSFNSNTCFVQGFDASKPKGRQWKRWESSSKSIPFHSNLNPRTHQFSHQYMIHHSLTATAIIEKNKSCKSVIFFPYKMKTRR